MSQNAMNQPQSKSQPDTTINSELDELVAEIATKGMIGMQLAMGDGSGHHHEKVLKEAKQLIEHKIAQEANKAVYGFHEYIMGMNIIRDETDQAFNYARLHRALDDYIAQLTADKEQA